MTIPLEGIWDKGLAFDLHSVSSTYLGVNEYGRNQFHTVRTPMGELVHSLKYNSHKEAVIEIIDLLISKISGFETFDAIIPCPPTKLRNWQPVEEIAKELGKRFHVKVINALVKEAGQTQVKDIDPAERERLLSESIKLNGNHDFSNQKLLLVDDLYQSGSTLSASTSVLKAQGKAQIVYVLTMTKTRG
jgi:competence protein ComFC